MAAFLNALSLILLAALLGLELWTIAMAHAQLSRLRRRGALSSPFPSFDSDIARTRTVTHFSLGLGALLVAVGLVEIHTRSSPSPSFPARKPRPTGARPHPASLSLSTVAAWLGIVAALQTLHTVDNLDVFLACGRTDVAKHALARIMVVNGVIAAFLALALVGRTVYAPSGTAVRDTRRRLSIPAGADALAFVV